MKKIVSLVIVVFFILNVAKVMAQHPSFTFFGGANMATTDVKFGSTNTDIEDSFKPLYGMNIGAFYDHVLNKDKSQEISVESGLIFENKGYHQKPNETQFSDNKTTLYYVDVPLYLKYRYRFRSRNKFYVGAGPYVGVGLFGNYNYKFQYPGAAETASSSESIKWGNDSMEDDYKRLDYGLSGKMGFLFLNGFNVCVSYDYGLANIAVIETEEAKNRIFRLSIGYTLMLDD
ncbi:MAG TPA: porin family protein [Draconibacterium sp.]|nr:porin family protein [Draconibacterium sp.]